MSSIDYLFVSGIRSFNPRPERNHKQQLKFFKPLTIILGQNGTGKTTLIEALRNACTGDLPPNSQRGVNFIQDPKLAGEVDVKGQIRMQFTTNRGQPMMVARSYQLTQRQKTQNFKTMDVTVQTKNDKGEIIASTYKCCDIDKLIPELLGVSKPIIDNVMFCHQEECNWPITEPKELKKRFDDIFAATRYTKALDEIRGFKKDQTQQQKAYESDFRVLEEHKRQAAKLENDMVLYEQKLEMIRKQKADLTTRITKLVARWKECDKVCQSVNTIRDQLKVQQAEVKTLESLVETSYQKVDQEFTESDEDLHTIKAQFDQKIEALQEASAEAEQNANRYQQQLRSIEESLNAVTSQKMILEEQSRMHQNKLSELQGIVREISEKYGIAMDTVGQVDSEFFNGHSVLKFVRDFQAKVDSLQNELQTVKKQHNQLREGEHAKVNDVTVKIQSLHAQKDTKEKSLERLKIDIKTKKAQIEELTSTKLDLKQAEQEEHDIQEQAKRKETEVAQHSTVADINQKRKEIEKSSKQLQSVATEMQGRESEQEAAVKFQSLRTEQEKKQQELQDLMSGLDSRLVRLLGKSAPEPQFIDVAISDKLREKNTSVKVSSDRVNKLQQKLAYYKSQREHYQAECGNIKNELNTKKERLATTVGKKSVSELLDETNLKIEHTHRRVVTTNSLKLCYTTFMQQAQERNECPVCARGFTAAHQLQQFLELQQEKLNEAPKHIKKHEAAWKEAKELAERLRGLQTTESDVKRLMEDLPKITKNLKSTEEAMADENYQLKELTDKLNSQKVEETEAQKLQLECSKISQLYSYITTLKNDVRTEEMNQARLGRGASRPLDVVRKEHSEIQSRIAKLNDDIEKLRQVADDGHKELDKLQSAARDKNLYVEKLKLKVQRRTELREQYDAKVAEYRQLQDDIKNGVSDVPRLEKECESLLEELQQRNNVWEKKEQDMQNAINKHQRDLTVVTTNVKDIQTFLADKKDKKLQELEQERTRQETRIQSCKQKLEEQKRIALEKRTLIENQSVMKYNIDVNIEYRQYRRDLQKAMHHQNKLREQLNKAQGHLFTDEVTEGEAKDCFALRDILNNKINHLKQEEAEYNGQLNVIEQETNFKKEELQSSKYDKVHERHRSTMIKLKTTEISIKDLDRYASALELALLRYHSQKMSEINHIIKELWHRTYRGQDIDYIEIRCDEELMPRRTNYNYQVHMVKGDVHLEMRGRCSAGQKVLASLVIRLALSEAFCVDCAILALDEPTTNLDHENIASLADGLHGILEARKEQKNFQLIVITHDEEFVRMLGTSDVVDQFYYVSKDAEGAYSQVEKRNFKSIGW